jgi:hypothetical protein
VKAAIVITIKSKLPNLVSLLIKIRRSAGEMFLQQNYHQKTGKVEIVREELAS